VRLPAAFDPSPPKDPSTAAICTCLAVLIPSPPPFATRPRPPTRLLRQARANHIRYAAPCLMLFEPRSSVLLAFFLPAALSASASALLSCIATQQRGQPLLSLLVLRLPFSARAFRYTAWHFFALLPLTILVPSKCRMAHGAAVLLIHVAKARRSRRAVARAEPKFTLCALCFARIHLPTHHPLLLPHAQACPACLLFFSFSILADLESGGLGCTHSQH